MFLVNVCYNFVSQYSRHSFRVLYYCFYYYYYYCFITIIIITNIILISQAAYRVNTLGLPKMCPPENIETINRDMLFTYLRHQCTPDQLVLAGSGMPHEQLVDLAEQYFTMYVSEVVFFLLNTHVCRVISLVIGWFFCAFN